MEEQRDIRDDVPCSSITAESVVRFGTGGAIWGLCIGLYDSRKNGLTGFSRASYVVKSVGKLGLQCGVFAGIYTGTQCGVERYRRKKDMLNASIAGAVSGAAVAIRTRSWTQVVGTAVLVSGITSAANVARTN
ncbi:outer envelope pore protein 16-4, chloroplastic-like isoform X1 [Papaver somniferum]|uniref:outer envelope pore protein 16-4, chloroplastic-like isoform X1 n=1 Tax=Papaver somniferum TaxID=3469 RepID=UPI000E6F9120|nr:outer envelope pore protein 16-4, chloroplastic-like isoform X1 [Papaver somniferum]XP_026445127.1 outer envelope pore protein 16-4, chloroplastic-like isoform X1 [Papaver somniferum]